MLLPAVTSKCEEYEAIITGVQESSLLHTVASLVILVPDLIQLSGLALVSITVSPPTTSQATESDCCDESKPDIV